MLKALVMGIDVGTGSAKGVLVDAEGHFHASAARSYTCATPASRAAEQDPEDWWDAVCGITRELMEKHPEAAQQLRGVGISGQGVAAVLLDRQRKPVRPAMLWMDTRATEHAKELEARLGEEIVRVSGKLPAAYNVEPKLLWIRENEPEVWGRVECVLTTTAYINLRLTGRAAMNHSDGGILLSYDLAARDWSQTSLDAMDLPRRLFPELFDCEAIIGGVTAEASRQTGLPEGLPVVAGGEDTSSAGLAMGVLDEGDVQLSTGTACTVYVPVARPQIDRRLLTFPHVLPGLSLTGGSMVSGGISLEWLMKLVNGEASSKEERGDELARLSGRAAENAGERGRVVFLPYLAGELQPVNDGDARGVFFGLSLETNKADMLRAVMEGTAFAVRHNLEIARECGARPQRIFAVGGPSRNDLWCQIMADVNGLPLQAMDDRAGAPVGDAILAALGTGVIQEPLAMQRAHARRRKEFVPQADLHQHYDNFYAVYLQLYMRLKDLFPELQSHTRIGQ